MSWQSVRDRVAERSGVSKASTQRVLSALLDVLREDLVAGESVSLPKVGTLSRRWRAQRVVRSIHSAKKQPIDAGFAAVFRCSSVLKAELKALSPSHFSDPVNVDAWRIAETLIGDLDLYHSKDAPQLSAQLSDAEVRSACADAFGGPWKRVVEEYQSKTQVQVDFLAGSARRCWSQ